MVIKKIITTVKIRIAIKDINKENLSLNNQKEKLHLLLKLMKMKPKMKMSIKIIKNISKRKIIHLNQNLLLN